MSRFSPLLAGMLFLFTGAIPTAHLLCYQAKASKGLCAAGAPANAGEGCAKEGDCGGVKGQTSFCVVQPKFEKVTGIFVNNQLDSGEVDLQREDEFCVPSETR